MEEEEKLQQRERGGGLFPPLLLRGSSASPSINLTSQQTVNFPLPPSPLLLPLARIRGGEREEKALFASILVTLCLPLSLPSSIFPFIGKSWWCEKLQ